MRWISWLLIR